MQANHKQWLCAECSSSKFLPKELQPAMAPAPSKMKKPASAKAVTKKPAIMKKPSAKAPKAEESQHQTEEEPDVQEEEEEEEKENDEEVGVQLTKESLKDHNKFCDIVKKMDEASFTEALKKLDSGASQRLWKQFEASRKAMPGTNQAWQEAMQGENKPGSLAKKRKLLHCWIQSGKTCTEKFRTFMDTVTLSKSTNVKEKWLTKQKALAEFGKEELLERVKSGTIRARRNPMDKRYWEFQQVVQTTNTGQTRTKQASMSAKGKADQQMMFDFCNQDFGDLVEDDWALVLEEEEEEDPEQRDLAQCLGIKDAKAKKVTNLEEEMSKITQGVSKSDILDKMMKFKMELEKALSQVDAKEYEAKKAGVKEKEPYKKKKEAHSQLQAWALLNLTVTKCF